MVAVDRRDPRESLEREREREVVFSFRGAALLRSIDPTAPRRCLRLLFIQFEGLDSSRRNNKMDPFSERCFAFAISRHVCIVQRLIAHQLTSLIVGRGRHHFRGIKQLFAT